MAAFALNEADRIDNPPEQAKILKALISDAIFRLKLDTTSMFDETEGWIFYLL